MLRAGQIIAGRYRLEATLEEGGMASVWKALHVDLGHAVAVKFNTVRGPGASAAADRFLREARVAAAIRHRHVIDMIDYGLTDSGVPFIVMEFLDGMDLGDRLGVLPPMLVQDFLAVLSSSLRGLSAVHEAGVVHRDIKPENIFLVGDADGHFPKLLDFGISRATTRASGLRSSVPTIEGVLVGTPEYMSPEQARGLKDIDMRTDLYSMGAVAYEGLSGRLPFEAEAVGDLLMQITVGDRVPLSQRRPDIGPHLSDWVDRAMARDRDERFKDAREMRVALLEAIERGREQRPNWEALHVSVPGAVGAGLDSSAPTLGPEDAAAAIASPAHTRRHSSLDTLDSWDGVPAASGIARRRRRGLWLGLLAAAFVLAGLTYGLGLADEARESSAQASPEPADRAEVTQADVRSERASEDTTAPDLASAPVAGTSAANRDGQDEAPSPSDAGTATQSARASPMDRRRRPRPPRAPSLMRAASMQTMMTNADTRTTPFADPGF